MQGIKSVQVYFDCDVKKVTIRNSAEASSLRWMVVCVVLACFSRCGRDGGAIVLTESWGSTLQS